PHPAYLGTEPAPASPHSLRHSRRRTLARSPSLDPPTLSFLLTRQGPQPRLSWQVLGWSETSPPSPPTLLRWSHRRSGRPATVCKTHAPPASPRLGRLCQTRLRWSPAGVTLSRPLHPSRGDFQSSLVGLRPGARHLSLEGLCSRWQARQDDSSRHGVPASFLSARSSQRSSRCLPKLRSSGHLIQLVQKSALPQVPDAGARALVGGSRTRTPDHQLLPCCVHCASRTQCAGLGEPAFVLRPAVHRQCSNLARDRHRSQTPGRRDRRDRHPAYL